MGWRMPVGCHYISTWWHLSWREQRVFYISFSLESRHSWNQYYILPPWYYIRSKLLLFPCQFYFMQEAQHGDCALSLSCSSLFRIPEIHILKGSWTYWNCIQCFVCVFLCLRKAIIFITASRRSKTINQEYQIVHKFFSSCQILYYKTWREA